MIPQRRLGHLLDQAHELQRSNCLFHSADAPMSLLRDCQCDPYSFPSVTTHVLADHTDEVWRLAFSHDGEWLCTAGKDQTAILWRVRDDFAMETILTGHLKPISSVAFSPDDSLLLTSADTEIKMWQVEVSSTHQLTAASFNC